MPPAATFATVDRCRLVRYRRSPLLFHANRFISVRFFPMPLVVFAAIFAAATFGTLVFRGVAWRPHRRTAHFIYFL